MPKKELPESVNDFLSIIPNSNEKSRVIQCTDSREGEDFFSDFEGSKITSVALLRYAHHDVVALLTDDLRAIAVIANKNGFIAVEKHGSTSPSSDSNLAFRGDISHKRLNLLVSMVAGQDVTYQDDAMVKGETIGVDPSSNFARISLKDGLEIQKVYPSWYTEDWMNVRSASGESLTIRADRANILGAVTLSKSGMEALNIGDEHVESLKLNQPPLGTITASLNSPDQ